MDFSNLDTLDNIDFGSGGNDTLNLSGVGTILIQLLQIFQI